MESGKKKGQEWFIIIKTVQAIYLNRNYIINEMNQQNIDKRYDVLLKIPAYIKSEKRFLCAMLREKYTLLK